MKKLFLGLITILAFISFSTSAMARVIVDSSYVQIQNDDEKYGTRKCGEGNKLFFSFPSN